MTSDHESELDNRKYRESIPCEQRPQQLYEIALGQGLEELARRGTTGTAPSNHEFHSLRLSTCTTIYSKAIFQQIDALFPKINVIFITLLRSYIV